MAIKACQLNGWSDHTALLMVRYMRGYETQRRGVVELVERSMNLVQFIDGDNSYTTFDEPIRISTKSLYILA